MDTEYMKYNIYFMFHSMRATQTYADLINIKYYCFRFYVVGIKSVRNYRLELKTILQSFGT